MTDKQREILAVQIARVHEAQAVLQREKSVFEQMLVMMDPRLADPESGVRFDAVTMTIFEPEVGDVAQ